MKQDPINKSITAESSSLVDYKASLSRLGGSESLFKEFIAIFNDDGPVLMDQIATHIDAGDAVALEKSAHALKGLMSNFGAETCCQIAQRIETSSKNGDLEEMESLHQRLSIDFQTLVVELEGYR